MTSDPAALRAKVEAALEILGIRNLLLGIHDAAFPGLAGEDLGRGTPYSRGAAQFLRFIRELGFNGIQLGPQGITTPANPSPYDGSFFSRDPLLLAPLMLTRAPWRLLATDRLAALVAAGTQDRTRVQRDVAEMARQRIATEVGQRVRHRFSRDEADSDVVRQGYARFRRRNADWLERDALYEILRVGYGGRNWSQWTGSGDARLDRHLFAPPPGGGEAARRRARNLLRRHGGVIEDFCFIQYLIAVQHQQLRRRCRRLGLNLFGDCQIGMSDRDAWYAQAFLLPGYRLGAPPSRTNPDGQPWNYPVLDPRHYVRVDHRGGRRPGLAVRFLRARIDKLFSEFDGLRVDHPHGLICPWVYRADQPDPLRAVQTGARLFAAPGLADHPELAEFAIARPDQINPRAARFDDDWVTGLDREQVRQYGLLFEEIVTAAGSRRHGPRQIACEILSTQPYPIKRVMERYGQGRFRVTQKADLANEQDVYRSENARPEDWLMLGNHDTPPIWKLADNWCATGAAGAQAAYLATRLRIPEAGRAVWIERVAADAGLLVQAKFADLFVGPAGNLMVYFTDLLGMREVYNRPGSVSEANWSLRVDPDYRTVYRTRLARQCALNLPAALAMALRARGPEVAGRHRELITALDVALPQ